MNHSDWYDPHWLPSVNAGLNALATALLISGRVWIAQGRETAHRRAMLTAFGVSLVFLASYLAYHAQVGSVRFAGPAGVRRVYLAILLSHVLLAAVIPWMALATIYFGLRDRRAAHRRWARWTFPLWLYVSVTGVLIYFMLYHLYPAPQGESVLQPAQTGTGSATPTEGIRSGQAACASSMATTSRAMAPDGSHLKDGWAVPCPGNLYRECKRALIIGTWIWEPVR